MLRLVQSHGRAARTTVRIRRSAVVPSPRMRGSILRGCVGLAGLSVVACFAPGGGADAAGESTSDEADDEQVDEGEDEETSDASAGQDDDDEVTPSSTATSNAESVTGASTSSGASETTGATAVDTTTTSGTATGENGGSTTSTSSDDSESEGPGTSCDGGQMQPGFYVDGGKLHDDHCQEFIMRGVNFAYAWYPDMAEQRLADIGSIGANAVRVVLSTGGRWTRSDGPAVADLISWAKANRLVAMLEVHDSTGWAEQDGSVHPDDALAYWQSDDIRAAIDGQEAYVLINIANEAFGNDTTMQWEPFYVGAVAELRAAGIHHTLVVDAPNWGQDWENVMRDGDGATNIFEADPDRNVVFSIHMYNVYKTAAEVDPYFDNFLQKGLPLVVGEFAADHGPGEENVVDEDAIMRNAEEHGVGYLGWSWSGNTPPLDTLDITVGHDVNQLSPWGERLIHGENGIAATAMPCTCFE